MSKASEWTTPNCGVTHLEGIDAQYWATVDGFARLSKRYPACKFNKEVFDTVDEAKKAGEAWLVEIKQR
jgi:rubredoxin